MANDNTHSADIHERLGDFIREHDLDQMTSTLRTVFFDYLRQVKDAPPLNFDEVIDDVEALFEFLDVLKIDGNTNRILVNPLI